MDFLCFCFVYLFLAIFKSIKYEYYGTTVLISHLFEKKINLTEK